MSTPTSRSVTGYGTAPSPGSDTTQRQSPGNGTAPPTPGFINATDPGYGTAPSPGSVQRPSSGSSPTRSSWSPPIPTSPPPGRTRLRRIPPPPGYSGHLQGRSPAPARHPGTAAGAMPRQATRTSHAGPAGLIDSAENDICDTLRVSRWVDPLIDRLGHDPRSRYAELFWLPILGPSTILFLRHCVTLLDEACAGADQDVEIELTTTATRLGLGHRGGRNSPMARTIGRASRFGAARPAGAQALQVRRYMPPLTRAQVNRLPAGLRARHQAETKPALAEEDVTSARARRLALGLIQCGDQHDAAETQLSQWQVPPAVAADAVRWAWDVYRPDRALGSSATTPPERAAAAGPRH